jgi:hypothetical protein
MGQVSYLSPALTREAAMTQRPKANQNATIVFRRFRRLRNGTVLDAWKYGYRGWPIRIRKK